MIVPIHNSESFLRQSVDFLCELLDRNKIDYEVILVENGSHDSTHNVAVLLARDYEQVYVLQSSKGLGVALKTGMLFATKDYVWLTADDVPFGSSDLDQFIKSHEMADLLIGSKAVRGSNVVRSWQRKLFTSVFSCLRRALLKSQVGDSQGTFFLERNLARDLTKRSSEGGFLFTTQLTFIAESKGLSILECPITFNEAGALRKSTLDFLGALDMFLGLIRIRFGRSRKNE